MGDETVVLGTAPPILLSDVDLVVIVASLDDLSEWAPRKAELGAACEALMGEVRFSGRVDVGVMLARDLSELPARPGVYDMRARGRVLGGNPRIIEKIPDYAPSDIMTREALTLIENRSISLLDSRPRGDCRGKATPYEHWYRIARVYTDIAAAALSVAGAYVPGYAARLDLIRRMVAEKDGLICTLVQPAALDMIEQWTRFKLEPSIAAQGWSPRPGASDELWENAARDILFFWRQAAARWLDPSCDIMNPPGVDMIAGRIRAYWNWRNHMRGWRAFLSKVPVWRRIPLAASLGLRLVSMSPIDVVREDGMRLLEHRLTRGPGVPVSGARGGFPHRRGSWDEAVTELCSVWNGLVFARTDG